METTKPKKRQKSSKFTFKHFEINQDKCGMKVCTDSVLFGAFVTKILEKYKEKKIENLLDIGSGTGLLSILISQKFNFSIDSVEYDSDAYIQSLENIQPISFCENIKIHEKKIQEYETDKKYNCIISNPPFYTNGFLPNQKIDLENSKVKAFHTASLSHDDLIDSIERLILKDGIVFILLPENEMKEFEKKIFEKIGMIAFEKLIMKNKKESSILRIAIGFTFDKDLKVNEKEIIIRNEKNEYTKNYFELSKDFFIEKHFSKMN